MPPPGRDPNFIYFDSTRRPEPGTEYQNNSNRWPAGGPYDPNGQQYPDWVDPTGGYKIEYNVDGEPYYAWYPNGEYQGGNPFIDGDAAMERLMYPRYTADRLPDPNWRPSYPGERPPWYDAPESDWVPPPTPEYLEQTRQKDAARKSAADQQYESDRMQRQQAQEAGAVFIRDNKAQRWGVYYPPGYKGPKVAIDKSRTPDRGGLTEISDPRQLGAEGKDWQVYNLQGGWREWDNQPTMSFAQASQRQTGPTPFTVNQGAPPPSQGAPAAAAAAPPPPSWADQEASRRQEWEAGGKKGTEYFDRYGNYNPDGYSSGPQRSQEENQYLAQLRLESPLQWKNTMYDAGDWAGQDALKRMNMTKGPGGATRLTWDTKHPQYAALSAEQKSAGDAKMAAFNQQFDPNNAVNPANDKLYKVQQMSPELRARLMSNQAQSNPAQQAAWKEWGGALTQYSQMQQPKQPAPAPKPGPAPAPTPLPQHQNRQFANGNPFMNASGELRNRAVKKIGGLVAKSGGLINPFN
jgi:hypothetical protein